MPVTPDTGDREGEERMGSHVLDADLARRWLGLALEGLERDREAIDSLNVYPVPDGDTGTNLHLTLQRACAALAELDGDAGLPAVADAAATGALLGARGNSGIITSQLLRGWADATGESGEDSAGVDTVVEAFRRADEQAWAAVERPVEGTILSLSRAAALAAASARDAGDDLPGLLKAVADAAHQALEETTGQLDVLAEAGVVDAGGAGLVVIIEALVAVVTGEAPRPLAVAGAGPVPRDQSCPDLSPGGPAFEVMYLLDVEPGGSGSAGTSPGDAAVAALRAELAQLGDSLVVVGGAGLWNVHVHVDDPGAAVEAGVRCGRPHRIRITHLATGERQGSPQTQGPTTVDGAPSDGFERDETSIGVVAWAAGPGLAQVFSDAGVVPVIGRAGHRASTEEVLAAVRGAGTTAVVVLPNDTDTLAVARAAARAARDEGIRVTVVPTRAQVQGLAAAAVHDPGAGLEQDVALMSAAAGATRHGAVTVAAREAITMAGRCVPGDVLGVVDGDFALIGDDVPAMAAEVTQRLLGGGGELVTLVLGAGCPAGLADTVRAALRTAHGEVEVQVVDGGQSRYPVLVGVE